MGYENTVLSYIALNFDAEFLDVNYRSESGSGLKIQLHEVFDYSANDGLLATQPFNHWLEPVLDLFEFVNQFTRIAHYVQN